VIIIRFVVVHLCQCFFECCREVLKEDATGSLQASVDDVIQKSKRRRLLDRPVNVRLGMVSCFFNLYQSYCVNNGNIKLDLFSTLKLVVEKIAENLTPFCSSAWPRCFDEWLLACKTDRLVVIMSYNGASELLVVCEYELQMRHLYVVIDMSQAMDSQDLKPTRLLSTLKVRTWFLHGCVRMFRWTKGRKTSYL